MKKGGLLYKFHIQTSGKISLFGTLFCLGSHSLAMCEKKLLEFRRVAIIFLYDIQCFLFHIFVVIISFGGYNENRFWYIMKLVVP